MRRREIMLLLAACTFVLAQDPQPAAPAAVPKLAIEITVAPPADPGGPDKLGSIAGRITGECKDCTVITTSTGGGTTKVAPPRSLRRNSDS